MEPPTTDPDALAAAIAHLAAIGEAAFADDVHGPVWADWADHCWRLSVPATPADPDVLDVYLTSLDPDEAEALRKAVEEVDGK